MEMKAKEAIPKGTDTTPPLPPLAFSLYSTSLPTHCSSCFSPLSSTSPPSPSTSALLSYCTPFCALTDTPLHHSSSEHSLLHLIGSHPSLWPHHDSSDLRLSLRLLHLLTSPSPSPPPPRLFGLLSNHRKVVMSEECGERIISGARAMARARKGSQFSEVELELEEAVLCLVMTNAVEVFSGGVPVGVAVYDWRFSWINHSCSPNSCFRFVSAFEGEGKVEGGGDGCEEMRIAPFGGKDKMQNTSACTASQLHNGRRNYGPRVIVRSTKEIQIGEEVTITYTDLMQPTLLRQSELLLKYQFVCNCRRCTAVPQTYVDHALDETFCTYLHKNGSSSINNQYKEKGVEMLRDMLNTIVEEYMELGNAVKCCEKIEGFLSEAPFKQPLEQVGGGSHIEFQLSPLHHLSLNAYTTLISTYKIRATLSFEVQFHSFHMSRTSAAYCLLLAGATHHLFLSEPSLIASAATFWIDAGQSLLNLARSSSWSTFENCVLQNLVVDDNLRCSRCLLMDDLKVNSPYDQALVRVSDHSSQKFLMCISIIARKVWSFLTQGCKYLKDVRDPIDFSWLGSLRTSSQSHHHKFYNHVGGTGRNLVSFIELEPATDTRASTFQLGVHCLLYGGYLSSICYGSCPYKIDFI